MEDGSNDLLGPTASVVAAFVANHKLSAAELSGLITAVGRALGGLDATVAEAPDAVRLTPAQVRKSITPNALISFEDGKGYKTLKRHLSTRGMTTAEYKAKWGLPNDYPTTAPSYSATRSAMAKSFGFGVGGRKPAAKAATAAPKATRTVRAPKAAPAPRAAPAASKTTAKRAAPAAAIAVAPKRKVGRPRKTPAAS
ncbi:MAG TPA: MucR family transcriptional regulator [Caulobacteraceae bacterium]|nr:MucR family transcriptional regulator [Caulobacteraceae bacterium]